MKKEKKRIYNLIEENSVPGSIVYGDKDVDINKFEYLKASKEIELFVRVLKQNFPNEVYIKWQVNL